MCSTKTPTSAGNNTLSSNIYNTSFLPGFSSSQAVSWWLGHVEPDDVVIADIAGQALDIFLHGPESAHKNGIVKTFTHTSIPIHPCTLLKQTKSETFNWPNMTSSFSCPLPVQCGGGRLSRSLAPASQDCSMLEALSPRTVLTVNISRCVQQTQATRTTIHFFTLSLTNSKFVYCLV